MNWKSYRVNQNSPEIVLICSNRWNSAIAEYAISTALSLRLLGCETTLIGLSESPLIARANHHRLKTVSYSKSIRISAASIKRTLSQIDPQFVFLFGGPETFLLRWNRKKRYKIFRFFGSAFRKSGFIRQVVDYLVQPYRHIDAAIFPNTKLRDRTHLPGFYRQKWVVPLGLPAHDLASIKKPSLGHEKDILVFGRFDPVKGHREFLSYYRTYRNYALSQGSKPARLRYLGMPANLTKTDFEKAVLDAGLKLSQDVVIDCRLLAQEKDLELASAGLGVICSLGSEEICRVGQEFLLAGTPVLVSGVGGLDEILFSKLAGASYQGLDEEKVAKIIHNLLLESEEQRHLRSQKAKKYFSIQAMAEEFKKNLRLGKNL